MTEHPGEAGAILLSPVGASILIAYLTLLVLLGVAGRRARRENSLADFFLAGRNMGLLTLFLTLYATQYSGNAVQNRGPTSIGWRLAGRCRNRGGRGSCAQIPPGHDCGLAPEATGHQYRNLGRISEPGCHRAATPWQVSYLASVDAAARAPVDARSGCSLRPLMRRDSTSRNK